jgi:hypothetical protein
LSGADNSNTAGPSTNPVAGITANERPSGDDPPRQQQQSISEKAFIDRIKTSDRWLIGLTGLIAAGGLISAIIFEYQLREMQTASYLTRESIRISEEALRVSRDTFIATQRPWLSVEMTISGPLVFDSNGAQIDVGVQIKNHGHSPAMNARELVVLDPAVSGRKGSDFCELLRKRSETPFARVIFPGDTISEIHGARADNAEIKNALLRNGTIAPTITACVDYISRFDNVRHQTQVTASLLKALRTPDDVASINPSQGNVPKSDLHLENIFDAEKAD